MVDTAIRVEGLGKRYRIGRRERYRTLRETITGLVTTPIRRLRAAGAADGASSEFWALRNVSFEVRPGEVLGIIGRNGAGKSTLLKLLSRITDPTEGQARIRGRVGSLLEVGTGFHPELTGRENVYLNGAILGMRRSEIARKFDEIVAFSEVEEFLETPVKRYSSGMYTRLAFAVAAHLEPEVLIVDEVLAVGDASFQQKCTGKMGDVARQGRTVLFVSHNLGVMQALCSRGILLRQGALVEDAPIAQVVNTYLSALNRSAGADPANPERSGDGQVQVSDAAILDATGQATGHLTSGRPATVRLTYRNPGGVPRFHCLVTIYNQHGTAVTNFNTYIRNQAIEGPGPTGRIDCQVPRLPLPNGLYRVSAELKTGDGGISDLIPNLLLFEVDSSIFFESGRSPMPMYCGCMVDHQWHHEPGP